MKQFSASKLLSIPLHTPNDRMMRMTKDNKTKNNTR